MKKSIIFFSFLLSLVFAITMFSSNVGGVEKASAKSLINSPQSIIIVGSGEVEVAPDTVQINFGLKSRADDLLSGQTKMKENIDSITKKIQEVDKDAIVSISFSSSYPINHGGIFGYEVDCCLTAKSSKVENVTELTEAIISSNITSVHNTNYMLTNKEEAYIQALVKAKENADSKAKAMFSSATFKGLKEESYYNFCESSKGDSIKICAKVRAFYEIGDTQDANTTTATTEESTATNAFEVNKEKTPVSSNKISNEKTNKEESNKENSLPTTQTENKQETALQNEEIKENNTNKNNNTTSVSAGENKTENEKTESSLQTESQTTSAKNQDNLNDKKQEEIDKENEEKSVETSTQNKEDNSNNFVNAPKGSIIDANGNVTKIDEVSEQKSIENNNSKNNSNISQEENQNSELSNKKSA